MPRYHQTCCSSKPSRLLCPITSRLAAHPHHPYHPGSYAPLPPDLLLIHTIQAPVPRYLQTCCSSTPSRLLCPATSRLAAHPHHPGSYAPLPPDLLLIHTIQAPMPRYLQTCCSSTPSRLLCPVTTRLAAHPHHPGSYAPLPPDLLLIHTIHTIQAPMPRYLQTCCSSTPSIPSRLLCPATSRLAAHPHHPGSYAPLPPDLLLIHTIQAPMPRYLQTCCSSTPSRLLCPATSRLAAHPHHPGSYAPLPSDLLLIHTIQAPMPRYLQTCCSSTPSRLLCPVTSRLAAHPHHPYHPGSYAPLPPDLLLIHTASCSLVAAVARNEWLEQKPLRALNEQQFLLVCCVPLAQKSTSR